MLAPSQTVQDLQRARNLIADPEKWTDDLWRLDGQHFCAITADLHSRAIPERNNWRFVSPYLIDAARELYPEKIWPGDHEWERVYNVNDTLGHEAVMRMYDRAIQLAMAGTP